MASFDGNHGDFGVEVRNRFSLNNSGRGGYSNNGRGGYSNNGRGRGLGQGGGDTDMDMDMHGWQTVTRRKGSQGISSSTSIGTTDDVFDNFSLEQKLASIHHDLSKLTKGQDSYKRDIELFTNTMQAAVNNVGKLVTASNYHTEQLKLLSYKSIDLEARSRRSNLIFKGFPYLPRGNCFQMIRSFLCESLDLDGDNFYLERAHWFGKSIKTELGLRRAIIVSFRDFADIDTIMGCVYKLRNTPYVVDRDYPYEILEARKRIWPKFKLAKQNRSNRVMIQFPAKLVVNGVVEQDEFPDWFDVMRGSRDKFMAPVRPEPYCVSPDKPRPKRTAETLPARSKRETQGETHSQRYSSQAPEPSRDHRSPASEPVRRSQSANSDVPTRSASPERHVSDVESGDDGMDLTQSQSILAQKPANTTTSATPKAHVINLPSQVQQSIFKSAAPHNIPNKNNQSDKSNIERFRTHKSRSLTRGRQSHQTADREDSLSVSRGRDQRSTQHNRRRHLLEEHDSPGANDQSGNV